MATPHVAGVLALMKSVNPALDAADFDRLLAAGALTDDLGPPGRDDGYGHGLINARRAIDAALNEAGDTSTVGPRLAASTTALSFGSAGTRLGFTLRNSGGGELTDVSVSTLQDWILVMPATADAAGLGEYEVTVDRSGLSPGVYEGTIAARSAANSVSIRVLLSVADALESELGQIYLLLVDTARDQPVAQALAERDGDAYRFSFGTVAASNYQIYAGTDLDNDLLICDPGEACGAYLTIDQPLTVEIDRDRSDLDFAIEYLIALPGVASQDASDGPGTYPLIKRTLPTP
jgi:serine protease